MLSVLPIPYSNALFLAKRMDIREIRRKNLILLREQEGSVRALADRVDTDPNYFSQILGSNGKHNMGHQIARRLEKAFNKPGGWMDQPHDADATQEQEIAEIAEMIKMLPASQRYSVKSLVQSMLPSVAVIPPAYQADQANQARRILSPPPHQ